MNKNIAIYIFVMAFVTYLVRMLPFTLFKRKIKSKFIKSFLFYIPYAVLGSMTIPNIFYSTGSIITAVLGLIAALILAYYKRSLLTVAVAACIVSYLTGVLLIII